MNNSSNPLEGIFAASLTPLTPDFAPDLESIPGYLGFLAKRGCHGALILGTTGEGPSFACTERQAICQAALEVRQDFPDFKLLAGTGTPSLEETIVLTRKAFDLGYDGVVVLPPYYFRKVSEQGLFAWFSRVIEEAVPAGMPLLYYHIPSITGITLTCDFLSRLLDAFPGRFRGLKDSSGDAEFALQLGNHFGKELVVLTGNDRYLKLCLSQHGSGCITAMANLYSPLLRQAWDAHQQRLPDEEVHSQISAFRTILERYAPFPPILKGLVNQQHHFPTWTVRPPLLPASPEVINQADLELAEVGKDISRL